MEVCVDLLKLYIFQTSSKFCLNFAVVDTYGLLKMFCYVLRAIGDGG